MAYTNIDDPSAHFQTALYTGEGSTVVTVTNDGNSDLQPDFLWFKRRDAVAPHVLLDTSRGANVTSGFGPTGYSKALNSNSNAAEVADSNGVMTITSDGFTSKEMTAASGSVSTGSMVCWQWHCNGGTTSTNNDGSLTSTVQVNQDAGFSIVTYAGASSTGTIGHGLGEAPKVILVRARNKNVPTSWIMYHEDGSTSDDDYFILNGTFAKATQAGIWNNQYPSSTVFGIANDFWVNQSGVDYLAYCFAEKQGYSKFGKYVGNGSASNGSFVYTGFKPAFVMTKSTGTGSWSLYDHKRLGYNPIDVWLRANGSDAESTGAISGEDIDLLSNGFKLRNSDNTINGSGQAYIYMAFAENPFVTSTGIPTTAR